MVNELVRPRPRPPGHRGDPGDVDPRRTRRRPASSPRSSPHGPATRRSSSRPTRRSPSRRPRRSPHRSGSCTWGATATTRRSSRWPSGSLRRASPGRSSSASPTSTSSWPARRLEIWGDDRLLEVRDVAPRCAGSRRTSSSTTCRATSGPSRSASSAPIPPRQHAPGPARPRRPRVGRSSRRSDAAHPRRRRRRSVPRDGALVPAQRRALRPRRRLTTRGRRADRRDGLGPRHLRGLPADDLPRRPDPGHRPAAHECPRRGDRHAQEPGDRHPRSGRAGPALRGPVDDPHRRGARLATPEWARTIVPGPRGAPLLYAGSRDGLPTRGARVRADGSSDLPLQVAFPILIANLTGELLGGSTAPADAVEPGAPVSLTIPPGASGLTVDASGRRDDRARAGYDRWGVAVTYAATDLPGIYTVTPIPDPMEHPSRARARVRAGARARPIADRGIGAPDGRWRRGERPTARGPAGPGPVRGRPVRRR